jgi:hypothetical protein
MMKSLDILIGLSVVMLVASMAVTVLTQIWTTAFNTRGTHLRDGLIDLLNQVHAVLSPEETKAIAEHILLHPLIRDSVNRMGSLIHRDELTRLLLEAAAGQGPSALKEAVRAALANALAHNGISDPGAALGKIREIALMLETSAPALTNSARHDMAILQAASTPFVAKINCWFDQTVDRISARFTFKTRQITLVAALALAVGIQMDTVVLVNRLSGDDALRAALIQKAYQQKKLGAMNPRDITLLASRDIFPAATSFREWKSEWRLAKVPGIALSVLLLSLGAPFWFETLKNMLRLRSLIAVKDDDQRAQRNSPVT